MDFLLFKIWGKLNLGFKNFCGEEKLVSHLIIFIFYK